MSVDHCLDPEVPFPAGLEDCHAVLHWTHARAEALGLDRTMIAIGGGRAAGGLAAALGLLARDRGEVPAFQLSRVPMLDERDVVSRDRHPYAGEFVCTPENNLFGWTALLRQPPGGKDMSQYAAPARAESLTRLPPTVISTGAVDLFLEENMEYARRLIRAGVPTELHVYPGAYHRFSQAAATRVTEAGRRDYFQALVRAFEVAPVRKPVV